MIRYFIILSIVNFIDGLFTFIGLSMGAVEEANPLMAYLWDIHPSAFLSVKFLGSIAVLIVGIRLRNVNTVFKYWRGLLLAVTSIYTAIIFTHFWWMYIVFL